jgi:Na+/H+ antiporter NhaB
MKPFTKIAAVLFGIAALIHAFRLISPFQIMIGNNEIPTAASIVIIILGLICCVGLWKESNK